MVISAAAAATAAAVAAGVILRAEQENAILNGGSYLVSGQPKDFTGKVGQQLARKACLRYGADPAKLEGSAALQYEGACRPYLDSLGIPNTGGLVSDSLGGTCPGVQYRIRWRIDGGRQGCNTPNGTIIPVSSGNVVTNPLTGPLVWENISTDFCSTGSGVSIYGYRVTTNGGVPPFVQESVAIGVGTERFIDPSFSQLVVERVDGQQDCPPDSPTVVQPQPDPTPRPPRSPIIIAPNISIDSLVEVNIDGSIDIDIGTGDITINPFENDDGDGGGGGLGPSSPGDIGSPGMPASTGAGGDAEGEAPPGSVLTGLQLSLETLPLYAREYAPGVFRGACYVYMGVPGRLDQDFAGALLRDNQFVFAELDFFTAWRVTANPGFGIRVTPFYREV